MRRFAVLPLLWLSAGAAAQGDVDPLVAQAAANLRASPGQAAGGRIVVTGARGEGRTLILDIDVSAEPSGLIGAQQVVSIHAAVMCADRRSAGFFSDGRVIRVDVVRNGRSLGSATADRCPGAIGEGLSAATFAAALQSFVGVEEGGIRITSVRAEGNSLIITVDVVSGAIDRAAAAANFVVGFCRGDAETSFFGRGLTLRVDATVRGRDLLTGTPLTSCPER